MWSIQEYLLPIQSNHLTNKYSSCLYSYCADKETERELSPVEWSLDKWFSAPSLYHWISSPEAKSICLTWDRAHQRNRSAYMKEILFVIFSSFGLEKKHRFVTKLKPQQLQELTWRRRAICFLLYKGTTSHSLWPRSKT